MLSKKFIILLLFLISSSYQRLHDLSVPPRDSFKPIKSGVQTAFELAEDKTETYYTFDNQHESSDIVVSIKNGHTYTTRIYFYESYDKIKTDENGNYINFAAEFDLSEKLNYLQNSKKGTYYLIIKDLGGYRSKDVISIFNEEDILELKADEPFVIQMFFKKNLYSFSFSGEQNELIQLEMNINDKSFLETMIILKNDEEIYKGQKNQGIITLNEEKEKGEYKVYISSTDDEIYKDIKSSIILNKLQYKVNLIEEEKEINVFYSNTKNFNFYIDINDYSVGEENMITFKLGHNAQKNKFIEYCYAKNMNFKEFNDDKFMSNMPTQEEESESYFTNLNSMDIISHLYFSRTQPAEQGKKSFLLVRCQVTIDEQDYFDPEKITIYLSARPELLDFTQETSKNIKINKQVQIKTYIPKIYKVKIPVNDNSLSYVFYSNPNIQIIYEDSMLNADYDNEESLHIFAISNKDIKKAKDIKIIYIKLFGAEQKINLRIESTESEIYYTNGDERPYKTIPQQHLNCGLSYYFIGSYSILAYDTYFYLEEIYGKYNVYYKNEISEDNEDSVLINSDAKFLVENKIGNLSKYYDIIELKCEEPGYFNLHLLKNYFSKTLTVYQRQVAIVSKGSFYIYPKKNLNEGQKKINLEISTPLGKEIKIGYNNIINSEKKYYQAQYKNVSQVPEYIQLTISEDNTLISVRLTDNNLYQIVDGTSAKINEELILFKLPQKEDYKNVNITINRVFNDYLYTLFRGNSYYGTDMGLSGYETIPLGSQNKINIILSNPYIKHNIMDPDKDDSPFYIAFYVKDTDGYQKGINVVYTPVDKYDKDWENSVITTISADDNNKYNLKPDSQATKLSIIYQSCGNSLKEIKLYSYDDILNTFENKNKINLGVFNNYLITQQISPVFINEKENKYEGAQISLSLREISKEEIDKYNNNIYQLKQNGKQLLWDNLNAKEYTIYVFNKKNENLTYIDNICFLESVKKKMEDYKLKNESDPSYIGIYTTGSNNYDIKEEGKYYITVVAESDGLLKYIFNKIEYDSSKQPDDNDKDEDEEDHTLLIVLSVVIPIIIIAIIILVYILWRKKKNDISKDLPEENQQLIRNTVMTNNE